MKIVQSLNQNALLVNYNGNECIVVGKGIGFGKKKGDEVDSSLISKVYKMTQSKSGIKYTNVYENIDEKSIEIAEDITRQAERILNKEFTGNFILSLANHIQYLENKYQNYLEIPQVFNYELRYLYPKECELAEWSVNYLNKKYKLQLPDAEISFFTLHFVNGLLDGNDFTNVVELSDILNDVIEMIEVESKLKLDRETLEFSRFILHLRYFIIRNLNGKNEVSNINDEEFEKLYELSFEMYPIEKIIIEKLKKELEENYNMKFGNSEDFYLLLHIVRILNTNKKEDENDISRTI